MIHAPQMLLLGSAGRNSGKTLFASRIIEQMSQHHPVIGAKVTTISERNGACPRGGEGCGVCGSLEGNFCITEEKTPGQKKDTQRLLAAGAERVFWLRAHRNHLGKAAQALLETIGPDTPIVCESNSLRSVIEPSLFLMLHPTGKHSFKESAQAVDSWTDLHIAFDGSGYSLSLDALTYANSQWATKRDACALVMAEGESNRINCDKTFLTVHGKPMVQHTVDQLRPHFEQIIICADNAEQFALIGLEIVVDKKPGQGPLIRIIQGMEASRHDRNMVVACDMPEIDIPLMSQLLREARTADGVVPQTGPRHLEPLFAVYRKEMLPALRTALDAGEKRIHRAFDSCNMRYIQLPENLEYPNLSKNYLAHSTQSEEKK